LPDNALLGGFAIAFFGLLLARDSRCVGGLLLGTGVGVGFMAKGMFALGVFGLTTLILPILFTEWCTRRFAINVLVACAAVAPWLLLWPIALYLRSPVLFHDWLWVNNIGRFMGFTVPELGAAHERGFWWRTLPWFTFPALPMACYAVIRRRGTALRLAPYQLCMVGFAVTLSVLWVSASARQVYALPLLIPLALAAVPAVRYLGTIGKFWELASAVVFVPLAASLWGVWFFAVAQGAYPEWTWLNRWFPAGYQSDLSRTGYAGALGLTLAVVLLRARAEPPLRALVTWTAGLALVWGLSATLWLPWIDAAKSYRVPFVALRTVIGQAEGCVSSLGLGESERAMLDYVAGVVTERLEQNPRSQCEMLLVETVDQRPAEHFPKSGWRLLWSGARPANSRERFWLFKQEHRQI
jgi:4-amino-4-deoxy-L-arabinose transferase-like glycosyltransferase